MNNTEKPKIQKLECLEDLELLVRGDVIIIKDEENNPTPGLYYGRNFENEFIFVIRKEKFDSVQRIAIDKKYINLLKDGCLEIKSNGHITRTADLKYSYGSWNYFNELLENAKI